MTDRDWLDKVALAASVHCENPHVDEAQIDMFIEYLYRVYGYDKLIKIKVVNESSNNH
jgi:hypothetical protein